VRVDLVELSRLAGGVNGDILNSGRRLCNLGSILIHPKQIANDRFAFKDLLNRCNWDPRTAQEALTVSGRLRATGFELVSTYSVLRCPLRSPRLYFEVVLRASVRHTEARSSTPCDGRAVGGDSPDGLAIKPTVSLLAAPTSVANRFPCVLRRSSIKWPFCLPCRSLSDFISKNPLRRVSLL